MPPHQKKKKALPRTVSRKQRQGKENRRMAELVSSLTVFALAVFVGFEVITKVPPTLHTPQLLRLLGMCM